MRQSVGMSSLSALLHHHPVLYHHHIHYHRLELLARCATISRPCSAPVLVIIDMLVEVLLRLSPRSRRRICRVAVARLRLRRAAHKVPVRSARGTSSSSRVLAVVESDRPLPVVESDRSLPVASSSSLALDADTQTRSCVGVQSRWRIIVNLDRVSS